VTETSASDLPVSAGGFLKRHHFLLRRLHSLSGIVPVGVFVIAHLFTNAQMAWDDGGESFQHEVDFIHSMPALLFVEIALWSAIGFHAVLGVFYMMGWAPNNTKYEYQANWRYTMQRVTAWGALIFIFLHIATLRWRWDLLGWHTPFYARTDLAGNHGHGEAYSAVPMTMPLTAAALQYAWWVVAIYIVGVACVVYHWSNGLWTSAITWGATVSVAAQRRWGFACAGLGAALAVLMAAALYGSLIYDFNDMTAEQRAAFVNIVDEPGRFLDDVDVDAPADDTDASTIEAGL